MNFNAVNVVMFGVGAILVYAGIKDKNPKEVVTNALSHSATKTTSRNTTTGTPGQRTAASSAVGSVGTASHIGAAFEQPYPVTSN